MSAYQSVLFLFVYGRVSDVLHVKTFLALVRFLRSIPNTQHPVDSMNQEGMASVRLGVVGLVASIKPMQAKPLVVGFACLCLASFREPGCKPGFCPEHKR